MVCKCLTMMNLWQAYLAVLFHDLAARVAADPDFEDGSRFPSAARVFRQHADSPMQVDGN